MGYGIVKIGELYCEWSTAVDAPSSNLYPFDLACKNWGNERVNRAKERGHSYNDGEPDHFYWLVNRAGPREECLTLKGLLWLAHDNPATEWPKPLPAYFYIPHDLSGTDEENDAKFNAALTAYRKSLEQPCNASIQAFG